MQNLQNMSINPESDEFAAYLDSLNPQPNYTSAPPPQVQPSILPAPVENAAPAPVVVPMGPPSSLAAPQPPPSSQGKSVSDTVQAAIKNKYGYPDGMDADSLADAQSAQNQNQFAANFGKAINQMAGGIARVAPPQTPVFDEMSKNAGLPVDQLMQQRKGFQDEMTLKEKQEDLDPDSAKAAIWRKSLGDLASQVGLSKTDLSSMNVNDLKAFASGPEEFAAKLQNQKQMKEIQLESIRANKELAQSQKASQQQNQAMQQTTQLLESARGNPAAAQAERDLYSADKADSLMNLYGDPNKLSQQQVNLLAQEVGKMASGGSPSMHELQGISSNAVTGQMAAFAGRLENHPTAANAAAWVQQYKDYTDALKADAKKIIQDKYGRVIEGRKAQLGDDNYQALKSQYLDRFKSGSSSQVPGSLPPNVDQDAVTAEMKRRGLM